MNCEYLQGSCWCDFSFSPICWLHVSLLFCQQSLMTPHCSATPPCSIQYLSVMNSIYVFIYFFHLFPALVYVYLFVWLSIILMACQIQLFFFIDCDVGVFIRVGLVLYFSRISALSGESQILPAYIWVHIYIFFVSCQPTIWFIDSQGEAIFAEPNDYPVRVISAINVNLTKWWGTLSHLISEVESFFLESSLSC